ncbi:MAG: hypothetical protein AAFR14_12130, partial [Bacteroidota bacterium]
NGQFVGTVNNSQNNASVSVIDNYTGTVTTHTTIPTGTGGSFTDSTVYHISDLAFTPDGNLLVGVRTGCKGTWHSSYNHFGETNLLAQVGNLYNNVVTEYDISVQGLAAPEDSYGGVSTYTQPDGEVRYLATSSDMLDENGPHGVAIWNADSVNSPLSPLGAFSYGVVDAGDPKGVGGDVEVFNSCQQNCFVTALTPLCEGEDLSLDAGASAASYSWSGPNGFVSTDSFVIRNNVTLADAGTYFVTLTDSNNCPTLCSVEVIVDSLPVVSVGSNSPICEGDELSLFESGGDAISWSWSGPNGFSSSDQNPSILSAASASSGEYQVIVTNVNGCVDSSSINVVVNDLPEVTLSNPVSICINDGGVVNFTASPTGGIFTTTAQGLIQNSAAGTASIDVATTGLGVFIIDYTLTDLNGCTQSTTATFAISTCAIVECDCTELNIDFENDGMGNPFQLGDTIGATAFQNIGLEITSGVDRPIVIFDSSNPTGGDPDLGSPNENCPDGGPGLGDASAGVTNCDSLG